MRSRESQTGADSSTVRSDAATRHHPQRVKRAEPARGGDAFIPPGRCRRAGAPEDFVSNEYGSDRADERTRGGRSSMPYTQRERRLAVLAIAAAVAATLLALLVVGGALGTPKPKPRGGEPGQTAVSPARKQPTSAAPRVLTVEYAVRGHWEGGFNAEVRITNIGSQPVEGWSVYLQLPAGVKVVRAWSADVTQSAAAVTQVGFQATGADASPSSCKINGTPC